MNTDKENIVNNDTDTNTPTVDSNTNTSTDSNTSDTSTENNTSTNTPTSTSRNKDRLRNNNIPLTIPPCPYTSPNGITVDYIERVEGTSNNNLYVGIYKGKKVRINPDTWEPYFFEKNNTPIAAGNMWTSSDQASDAGKKGAIKAAETKRARKTLREELISLLSSDIKDKNGNPVNMQTAMSTSLIKQAILGNVNAFTVVRDTIGEKPTENILVNAEPVETEKRLTAEEIARKYLDDADAKPKKAQKEPIETTFVPEKP